MYFNNETDETLVMLTLAGEQSAYEVLVKRYENAVISSAMSVTKTRFMAEDAAQDAFVTAWMKLDTLLEPKKYSVWVCRIAKNCARNMITRYRSYLPLDIAESIITDGESSENPAELYVQTEKRNDVDKSIGKLPKKTREIINMHYFKGLSVTEIAAQMQVSEGNVKRQLYDGRKQIRKELCAMDETYSDTLLQRVMKKVEELKLWQLRNNKAGFEKIYREVLREIEELPESQSKQCALADVLMRGWWWLPGEKNDALFARISDAALQGKNEDVMIFIVSREDYQLSGEARIDFIRNTQIPKLEEAGMRKALGYEWFWLGYFLLSEGKSEEGKAAYEEAGKILGPENAYRSLLPYAVKIAETLESKYKDVSYNRYTLSCTAEEYRIFDNKIFRWDNEFVSEGYLSGSIEYVSNIFKNASICDSRFFADIAPGEIYRGSDGTTLSCISVSETVNTPIGCFENCQLWEAVHISDNEKNRFRTYYCEGVGIVRQDIIVDGNKNTVLLHKYNIKGGNGLLPMYKGNTWEYLADYAPETITSELIYTVSYSDKERSIITNWCDAERIGYDQNSWCEAVEEIAQEYVTEEKDGTEFICDVTSAVERAERLALTPMEKAHTKAAAAVAKRIMETDTVFNPNYTTSGHWNFFNRNYIRKTGDSLIITGYNPRWSFEWKETVNSSAMNPILFNDILGILQDAVNCIWSDLWCVGTSPLVEYTKWDITVKTQITCTDGGTVKTQAGTFENCLKINLDIAGMDKGLSYRSGKKVYYFAEGVGIVRTENEYCGGSRCAVYELTSYEGTGDGFMPLSDGFVRRYDAQNLTDGYCASVEYVCVADDDGDIVIFSDRTGIRKMPPPITQYSMINSEIIEQKLRDSGKVPEVQTAYGVNNFRLFSHIISRPSHNRKPAKRSAELHGFYRKLIELFGNGKVPSAWYTLYVWSAIMQSAALFGDKRKEEGYEALDAAIQYSEKISELQEGELLDVGLNYVFGGVKYEYENDCLILPDGSKEPADSENMDVNPDLYGILTAKYGWEWFNSVRDEDRFKERIERARKINQRK